MANPRFVIEVDGLEECLAAANADRTLKKPLKVAMRQLGQAVKKRAKETARPVSRTLARYVSLRAYPERAVVTNRAAHANTMEVGRRPGAKAPPTERISRYGGVLKGGRGAAVVVARRGLPGHHVMARTRAAASADLAESAQTIGELMAEAWETAKKGAT